MRDTTTKDPTPTRRKLVRTAAIAAAVAAPLVMSAGCFGASDGVVTSTPTATASP